MIFCRWNIWGLFSLFWVVFVSVGLGFRFGFFRIDEEEVGIGGFEVWVLFFYMKGS